MDEEVDELDVLPKMSPKTLSPWLPKRLLLLSSTLLELLEPSELDAGELFPSSVEVDEEGVLVEGAL